MDFAKVGTGKTIEPAIDKRRSGIPISQCAPARQRSLPSIPHWIQCDFLVADYSQGPIGIFSLQVGLFGAVPYVVALFAMLFNGWHSDKNRERRWHAAPHSSSPQPDCCASSVCPARM